MKTPGLPSLRLQSAWFPAFAGVLYALVAGSVTLFRFAFEIDPDEGYNLMKVLLVQRGQSLYSEIWSDQPPGFTYLGVLSVEVLGSRPEAVRLVTALLAGALVFAICDLLRREFSGFTGLAAAFGAAVFLPATGGFAVLSVAAMIGLPSLAFAVLSLWALRVSRSVERRWLVAAGALFGASLVTKLFTALLLPLFVALLGWQALRAGDKSPTRSFVRAAAWSLAGLVFVLLVGLGPALAGGGFEQLYTTHAAGEGGGFRPGALLPFLAPDAWLYALALAGLVLSWKQRSALGLLLGAWCLLATLALLRHQPLWRHHALLISIPAAALAGVTVGYAGDFVRRRLAVAPRALALGVIAVAVTASLIPPLWPRQPSVGRLARREQYRAMSAALARYGKDARLMVTSRQMYAFRAGISVPPELAVTSGKHFRAGLTTKRIAAIVRKTRPKVILLDRAWPRSVSDAVRRAIAEDYRLAYVDRNGKQAELYVRSPAASGEQ